MMDAESSKPTADDLRKKFKELYADNIASNVYHEKDLERLEVEDGYCLRFLLHQKQILEKAAAMVDNSFKWRKEMTVNDLREKDFPREFHDLGSIYYHNVDKDGNKILHFQVSKHKKDPEKLLKQKQFIAWWIDKHFQKSPDEPIVVLFDMQGAGISNMDLDLVRFQISCFATYYPAMLAYMMIYEMPWVLNAVWKLIKQLLTDEQQKFVIFAKKSDVDKYIPRDQLLLHMGGTDTYQYQYLPSEDSGIDVNGEPEEPLERSESSSDISSTGLRRRVKFSDKDQTYTSLDNGDADDFSESTPLTAAVQTVTPPSNGKVKSSRVMTPSMDQSDRPVFKGSIMHVSPAYTFNFNVLDDRSETVDYMTIYNVTDRPMAYKVKTTNPDNYRVRTSSGTIQPRSSANVYVYLQPGVQNVTRDKFLVMGLLVDDPSAKGSALSQLWKASPKDPSTFCDHKLWCSMQMGDKPPRSDADRIMDRMDNIHTKGRRSSYHPGYDHDSSFSDDPSEPRSRRSRRGNGGGGGGRGRGGGGKYSSSRYGDRYGGGSGGSAGDWLSSILLWPLTMLSAGGDGGGNDYYMDDGRTCEGGRGMCDDRQMDRMLAKQDITEKKLKTVTNVLVFFGLLLLAITTIIAVEFLSDVGGKRPCLGGQMN